MDYRHNMRQETGQKDKHLIPQLTKGMKEIKSSTGSAFLPKNPKTQAQIRKEHGTKLKALKDRKL